MERSLLTPLSSSLDRRRRPRRKWKRATPQERQLAAQALASTFSTQWQGPRQTAGVLALLLVGSLALHGLVVYALGLTAASHMPAAGEKDAYLQKVIQKGRARIVAVSVAQKVTMPPPPPDPENVARNALNESLISDVTKLTGNLLDVKLRSELASYVKSNLQDELAAAAKDIADGRLTEDEIRRLHAKFQTRAHEATKAWREDYLEKHQLERAAVSTTEWYENEVSKTLFRNISFQLWAPPGYRDHPPSPELWRDIYGHAMQKGNSYPAFDVTPMSFGNRIELLKQALQGRKHQEEKIPNPAWPGPNKDQAQWLAARLRELHDGTETQYAHNYSPRASWDVLYGAYIAEYYPHGAGEIEEKHTKPLNAAWDKTIKAAEAYLAEAEQSASGPDLKAVQSDCLKAIGELVKLAEGVRAPKQSHLYRQLNSHVRTEVLRGPECEKAYRKWVETLLAGMEPLVRDFARGQFKKGIIKHKDGVEQAMKEFPATVVPLLRRDLEQLIPRKRFDALVFMPYQHKSKVTGQDSPPDEADAKAETEFAAKTSAEWPEAKAYMEARREIIVKQLNDALAALAEELLTRLLTGNLLFRRMDLFVEGVDYTDKVQEKLTAREMAMKGRGQDLARLTADGVPDASAPLVALLFGASKGHGANLEPVVTSLQPAMVTPAGGFEAAVVDGKPVLPPPPAAWGTKNEQAAVKPAFNTPRFEGIPFLTRFPRLDGDLSDWGRIRPLILKPPAGQKPFLVYAAWNYQGFFFGVKVDEEPERFYWPSMWVRGHNHNTGDVDYRPAPGWEWAAKGDYLRLMFDTLDARNANRGEPHTQEFFIFPQGTESDANVPGVERVIASQRDAKTKEYRGVKASCQVFPAQPPPENGPDGTGPYRVCKRLQDGYTMEVFLPRSLFKQPVFCPGWNIGFDCAIATGVQDQSFKGQVWAARLAPDNPDQWGDLLLLGTDPQIVVQEANSEGRAVSNLMPGYSYLVTVVDPDRNVNPAEEDSVLVSAEVNSGAGDVEVFVLKETNKNSGVFRGFINTQPGFGRQVQGVLEVLPMDEVQLSYVDWANAKGQRNVVYKIRLPVVSPVLRVVHGAPAPK